MKKGIKNVLTFAIVTTMVLSSSVLAFAEGGASGTTVVPSTTGSSTVPGEQKLDVYGRVKATGDRYCFDIAWENLQFDYENDGTWNPNTHTYDGGSGASGWKRKGGDTNSASFEVVNHSNRDVNLTATFEVDSNKDANFGSLVTVDVNNSSKETLEACYEGTAATWLTGSTLDSATGRRSDGSYCILNSVEIDGKPDKNRQNYTKLGYINLVFEEVPRS